MPALTDHYNALGQIAVKFKVICQVPKRKSIFMYSKIYVIKHEIIAISIYSIKLIVCLYSSRCRKIRNFANI